MPRHFSSEDFTPQEKVSKTQDEQSNLTASHLLFHHADANLDLVCHLCSTPPFSTTTYQSWGRGIVPNVPKKTIVSTYLCTKRIEIDDSTRYLGFLVGFESAKLRFRHTCHRRHQSQLNTESSREWMREKSD